jgi:hypothetical protein
MIEPDPNKRPSIDEILLHPIFSKISSRVDNEFLKPVETDKQVILISPSTVAKEIKQLRQSCTPFEIA